MAHTVEAEYDNSTKPWSGEHVAFLLAKFALYYTPITHKSRQADVSY